MQDKAHLSLEQQLKVIALRHNLLAQMDDILQDRKRMIATLQVLFCMPFSSVYQLHPPGARSPFRGLRLQAWAGQL